MGNGGAGKGWSSQKGGLPKMSKCKEGEGGEVQILVILWENNNWMALLV